MATEGFIFDRQRIEEHLAGDDPIEQALDEVQGIRNAVLLHALEGRVAHEAVRDITERLDKLDWVLTNL